MSSTPAGPGAPPYSGQSSPQQNVAFSGRVLLTAVVVIGILTLVFVLIRLILIQFFVRSGLVGRSLSNFGGRSSRHGLDAAALAELPVTAYRKDDGGGGSTSGTTCAVCLSELADGEKVRALPACRHVFHVECVDAWLRTRTTCPVCRAEVAPQPDKDAAGEPAVFGAGGTLMVTVQGGAAQTRGARTPPLGSSGQPSGAAAG